LTGNCVRVSASGGRDAFEGIADGVEVDTVEVIEQMAAQADDVGGDCLLQSSEPGIGEHSVVSAGVLG
jgi:hypothetical protein